MDRFGPSVGLKILYMKRLSDHCKRVRHNIMCRQALVFGVENLGLVHALNTWLQNFSSALVRKTNYEGLGLE